MKHRLLAAALACSALACVQTVALNPLLQPNASVSHKQPLAVAVVCSPRLAGFGEQASPSTQKGGLITYEIPELGETLCDTLTRSVGVYYDTVVRPDHGPRQGDYDRTVKFDLQNSDLDIQVEDNGWSGTTNRVTYTVSVSIEGHDRAGALVNRSVITGIGILSRRGSSTRDVVRDAVEMAVQQLADNASSLLVAGLAEPRDSVPASPRR
jgi:hypothetical protein